MGSSAIRLVSTKGLSREDWLDARNQGIGGSDAAAAVGLCPYKAPLQLWLEKTGKKLPEDLSEKEGVFWGQALEPIIATVYAEKTGTKVRRLNAILQHPKHAFMLVNLDRVVRHPTDGSGLLEIKAVGLRAAPFWEEGVPENYQCQVLHQLAVTGKPWADVAVLIGGQDFRVFRIERDDVKIQALIEAESRFWSHVRTDTPPPVDGSESAGRALQAMFPRDAGNEVDFRESAAMNELFEKLVRTRQQREAAESAEELLKQQVQEALGSASYGLFAGGKVSWKLSKDGTTTDLKRLGEENPALVARYATSKPGSRRFLVSVGK